MFLSDVGFRRVSVGGSGFQRLFVISRRLRAIFLSGERLLESVSVVEGLGGCVAESNEVRFLSVEGLGGLVSGGGR